MKEDIMSNVLYGYILMHVISTSNKRHDEY